MKEETLEGFKMNKEQKKKKFILRFTGHFFMSSIIIIFLILIVYYRNELPKDFFVLISIIGFLDLGFTSILDSISTVINYYNELIEKAKKVKP